MKVPEVLIEKSRSLPIVGLGTWLLQGAACTQAVKLALEIGYRHFDTAYLYDNHAAIGKALHGFAREKLFLTSKFTLPQIEREGIETICDRTLKELGTSYLDLYLLHYPDRTYNMAHVLHQVQQLIDKQKVRTMGVSNFTQRHLKDLSEKQIPIAVNQVEFHPYLNQKELLAFCQQHHIHLMSYRSLGKGALVADPIFEKIGKKYGKTSAQVSLRWLIEQKISVIPKAQSIKHL
ncbi:MAG TPA: aldo/keto reductase, partial [Waddliaceae bacterium]